MLPKEFIERQRRLLGDEFEDFLSAYDRPRSTGLRLNPRKRTEPLPQFCGAPIPWAQNGYYLLPNVRPGLHPYHDAGVYYLQEPSAMAPAALLDAQPGERVLDLCAAPGGKSTQLAAAMQGRGLLVCNEIQPKRARILSSNIERLGVTNALVLNEHPAALAARFPAYFDRIMVDAPCSGEGMFRKEEAALADWSLETVKMCAARQFEILCSAAQMLRSGGRLVYSTCTFAPEENEGVVSRFLKTHPDFSVVKVDAPWFSPGRPDWIDAPANGLAATFRLWQHRLHGEGQFAAVLERDGGSAREAAQERRTPLPAVISEFFDRLALPLRGETVSFGDTVWLVPQELPELKGLHVLRVGLELGDVRKGRFLPAHALALALPRCSASVSYPADSREIAAYLRGETLSDSHTDWTLICVDGYPLGWAKGSGGVLKNHYPKGLRRTLPEN